MIFAPTEIDGVCVIEPERHEDERGFFARTWCAEELEEHGLDGRLVQCSISFNARRGTLRGNHWQAAPHEEAKLVRCTRGAIYDVALDMRPDSKTYKSWTACTLDAESRKMFYIGPGIAHGFLTLADATEVFYQMSEPHHPESARGVRWDDPTFAIEWPDPVVVISDRDRSYPDFTD